MTYFGEKELLKELRKIEVDLRYPASAPELFYIHRLLKSIDTSLTEITDLLKQMQATDAAEVKAEDRI